MPERPAVRALPSDICACHPLGLDDCAQRKEQDLLRSQRSKLHPKTRGTAQSTNWTERRAQLTTYRCTILLVPLTYR